MKVSELIARLSTIDPNALVCQWAPSYAIETGIEDVKTYTDLECLCEDLIFRKVNAVVIGGDYV